MSRSTVRSRTRKAVAATLNVLIIIWVGLGCGRPPQGTAQTRVVEREPAARAVDAGDATITQADAGERQQSADVDARDSACVAGPLPDGERELGDTFTPPVEPNQPFTNFTPPPSPDSPASWELTSDAEYTIGNVRRRIVVAQSAGDAAMLFVVEPADPCGPRVLETYGVLQGGNGASIAISNTWTDPQRARLLLLLRIERRFRGWNDGHRWIDASAQQSWTALTVEPFQARVALKETNTDNKFRFKPTAAGLLLLTGCGDPYTLGTDGVFHPPTSHRCPSD
jgi:hypothetical protein